MLFSVKKWYQLFSNGKYKYLYFDPISTPILRTHHHHLMTPPRMVSPCQNLLMTPPRMVSPCQNLLMTPPRMTSPCQNLLMTPPRMVSPCQNLLMTPPRMASPCQNHPPGSGGANNCAAQSKGSARQCRLVDDSLRHTVSASPRVPSPLVQFVDRVHGLPLPSSPPSPSSPFPYRDSPV
jgi:hypothetical protein